MLTTLRVRLLAAVAPLASTLLVCAVLTVPAPARASVVPMSVEAMATVAEDVVHGTIEKQRQEMVNSVPLTISTVVVTERLKGVSTAADGKAEKLDVVSIGGRTDYYGVVSVGQPTLAQGQEVVLFLSNPGRRRLAAGQVATNPDSPMVKYPQVVGGFQGKFDIVRQSPAPATAGPAAATEQVRVMRPTPGRAGVRFESLPTLDSFKTQVRALTSGQVPMAPARLRLTPQSEPVPVPQELAENTALRFFDPLPPGPQADAQVVGRIEGGSFVPANPPPPSGS